MVAPEIVIVERLEMRVHRDHAGTGGIERQGLDGAAVDARLRDGAAHGQGQRRHMIGVALRGAVGIVLATVQRILAEPAPSRPRTLSNREARTLRVPKSTPATMLMELHRSSAP